MNSVDRIKRATLIGLLDMGGVNMVDVHCLKKSLNLGWIQRIVKNHGTWSSIITENPAINCPGINLEFFLKANLHPRDLTLWVKLNPDNPWSEILRDWCGYNYKQPLFVINRNEILGQTLWFNSCIKVANSGEFF